jgi:hypothetical protein
MPRVVNISELILNSEENCWANLSSCYMTDRASCNKVSYNKFNGGLLAPVQRLMDRSWSYFHHGLVICEAIYRNSQIVLN